MYNQIITPRELSFCIKQTELRNSGLSREEWESRISACVGNGLYDGTYDFQLKIVNELFLNAYPASTDESFCQDLILRKIYQNITTIYKVTTSNRNRIIAQIKTLLNEPGEQYVLRLDIHHFYESIDRHSLLMRLRSQGRLSAQTLGLIDQVFSTRCFDGFNGLPKGLNISAALSECYMKYFDLAVRKMPGVYYYARYVDDIIVFCTSQESQTEILKAIVSELDIISLGLNNKKTITWDSSQGGALVYLGYQFTKDGNKVCISIAPEKIKKIKTRITLSFVRYANDHSFDDLLLRIKYLTGNFNLRSMNRMMPIMVGVYYNYRYITDMDALKELQEYFEHILFVKKGPLGGKLNMLLTKEQRRKLSKYSFLNGFSKRIRHGFSQEQLLHIKNCWR